MKFECHDCLIRITIALSGFTKYSCKSCGKTDMYHHSATPSLCMSCANQNKVCIRCEKPLEEASNQ